MKFDNNKLWNCFASNSFASIPVMAYVLENSSYKFSTEQIIRLLKSQSVNNIQFIAMIGDLFETKLISLKDSEVVEKVSRNYILHMKLF